MSIEGTIRAIIREELAAALGALVSNQCVSCEHESPMSKGRTTGPTPDAEPAEKPKVEKPKAEPKVDPPADDTPPESKADYLARIKALIDGCIVLPAPQAKAMAKETLSEVFKFDKFGDVPLDKREEVYKEVECALG